MHTWKDIGTCVHVHDKSGVESPGQKTERTTEAKHVAQNPIGMITLVMRSVLRAYFKGVGKRRKHGEHHHRHMSVCHSEFLLSSWDTHIYIHTYIVSSLFQHNRAPPFFISVVHTHSPSHANPVIPLRFLFPITPIQPTQAHLPPCEPSFFPP